jgi:hypothetical protein
MRPPSEIRPTKRNNKYAEKTLQELMRKGAMVMENPSRTRFGLRSSNLQAKSNSLYSNSAPNLQKTPKVVPCSPQYTSGMDLKLSRMVRVGSFTTLTKLGSGTEESFTSLLISRV